MPGKIITVTSGKGGVGKTTTVANIATALAMIGQRVITVDADIGLRNLDIVLGLESLIINDMFDVLEQRCTLDQALVRDDRAPSLHLLPTSQTRDKGDIQPHEMVAICEQLRQRADYVLIDSPAGIEHGFHNSIAPADRVLVVTTPDVSALRDADKVIYLLESELKRQPWLILNRYNYELVRDGEMRDIDDILDILAIDLIGVVPEDNRVILTTDRGVPAVYDSSISATAAYRNIAQRILGNNVPLMRFDKPKGFFGFWKRLFGS